MICWRRPLPWLTISRLGTPLVEFANVTVMRGETVALDRFSLRIDEGERVAILGPNGSGKSTLIDALTRQVYPLADRPGSSLRIYGQEAWDLFELRGLLGIVTNELMRACTRPNTGLATVLSGFFGSIGVWPHHIVTAEMREKATAALELLDAAHLAERPMTKMSSGEARRTVIARALVNRPRALVLDEPMSSLDVRGRREVRAALRRLAAAGVSLILVTHQLEDLVPEFDRVVTLSRGRVLHDGPRSEVLTRDRLAELFGIEVDVRETDGMIHLW